MQKRWAWLCYYIVDISRHDTWHVCRCPVACGQCPVRCDNNNVHCVTWARRGECSNNPEYMDKYCSKACSSCSNKGHNRNCKDLKSGGYFFYYPSSWFFKSFPLDCPKWGQRGFCKTGSYVSYMKKNCKKTCKLCWPEFYKLFLVWSCVSLMCYKTLIASLHPNLTADARENWHVQCIATFCWKKFLHFTLVYNLSFFTPEKCRAQLVAPALCSPKYTLRLKYGKFDMIICSNFHRHARKIGFLSEN